jgi:hypothetical protein
MPKFNDIFEYNPCLYNAEIGPYDSILSQHFILKFCVYIYAKYCENERSGAKNVQMKWEALRQFWRHDTFVQKI